MHCTSRSIFVFCLFSRGNFFFHIHSEKCIASCDSQIDKPQHGCHKRAELLDVNINTGAQSINTERASLNFQSWKYEIIRGIEPPTFYVSGKLTRRTQCKWAKILCLANLYYWLWHVKSSVFEPGLTGCCYRHIEPEFTKKNSAIY